MNCPNLHERLTRGRNNGRSCYPISGCSGVDSIWLTLTQSKLKTLCRNYTFLDTISPTQYNPPAYSDQNTRDLIVLTWTERTSNDYWREGKLSAFQTGRLLKHSKFVNYLHNFYQVNLNWQHQQKLQLDAKHGTGTHKMWRAVHGYTGWSKLWMFTSGLPLPSSGYYSCSCVSFPCPYWEWDGTNIRVWPFVNMSWMSRDPAWHSRYRDLLSRALNTDNWDSRLSPVTSAPASPLWPTVTRHTEAMSHRKHK